MTLELYFVWNGIDSRNFGLVLQKRPDHMVAAERIQTAEIPGRSGFVTLTEGAGTYAGYILTLEMGNRRTSSPAAITTWLRGRGELVLSCEPNRVYYARLIQQASLQHLFHGIYSGKIQFNAQPLKGQYPPELDIVLTAAGSVYNPGDVHARPLITLTGSGLLQLNVNYDESDDDTKGSQITVDLTDTEHTGAIIDTDSMVITDPDGTENLCHLSAIYGNGPEGLWLPAGASAISWDTETVTGVTIRPRWRWL